MLELNRQYQDGTGKFIPSLAKPNLDDPTTVQLAYVKQWDDKNIYITDKYWESKESLTHVLNHEMSHFTGTDDNYYAYKEGKDIYGKNESFELAKKCPDGAYKHADSVAYWIEDQ